MSGEKSGTGENKNVTLLGNELLGLVIAYAKQETIDPLKSLARFVAFGVAGAILIATGGVLLALAAVRAAQAETGAHLYGNLTWVPYAGGLLLAGIGAIWAVSRIFKGTGAR
ncbi:MAG TPA: hypothetical protein VFH56_08630 [Acidimicrobiales bacterium]|nr:hypothetical protein [Acidimicrobiales bacterium]